MKKWCQINKEIIYTLVLVVKDVASFNEQIVIKDMDEQTEQQ